MGDSTTASEEAVTEAPPRSASPEESPANDWAKVYVGNLPNDLEEDGLRSLLSEKSLPEAETVLVKRGGYAFLEFSEQIKADEVISLMDGLQISGQTIKAEMSMGSDKKSQIVSTYRVVLMNVASEATKEDIDQVLLGSQILTSEISINVENATASLTYQTKEEAEKAVNELNETELKGQTLQARLTERRSPRRAVGAGMNSMGNNVQRHIEFPLRILVQSDMVGAIIGRGGQTIRQITQQTRARVDVHRKENQGSVEKAITIYGQPENCSNACLQILKVMQEEARNTEKSEDIPLKILAHNNLIGRIIGKQGSTIKRIMEETDTKITVSSINEINSFNMERIITIKGEPEKICKAEAEVSAKLRQAYESDLNSLPTQNVMFPGLHHPAAAAAAAASMVSPMGMGLAFNHGGVPVGQPGPMHHHRLAGPGPGSAAFVGNYYNQSYNNGQMSKQQAHHHPPGSVSAGVANAVNSSNQHAAVPGYGLVSPQDPSMASSSSMSIGSSALQAQETTHMYIPNASVGAVIGAKGSYIRDLNKYSGYSIKIASSSDETNGYPSAVNAADRRVTIVGPTDRFWAPQYLIYEKLKMEGFADPHDGEVNLTIEMFVPSSQVGRIIGKGGTNVRELQRVTGAMIKLPEQLSPPPKDETSVVVIGKWIQVLTAQQRLRAMVAQALAATNSAAPSARSSYQTPVNGNLSAAQALASTATSAVNVADANVDPDHDVSGGKPDEED